MFYSHFNKKLMKYFTFKALYAETLMPFDEFKEMFPPTLYDKVIIITFIIISITFYTVHANFLISPPPAPILKL